MIVIPSLIPLQILSCYSQRKAHALYEKPLLVADFGSIVFLVSESSSLLFRMYSFSSRNLQHNQKTPEDQCIHQMPDFYTVQHPTLQQIMKQGSPI